jgi:hypothetical protein
MYTGHKNSGSSHAAQRFRTPAADFLFQVSLHTKIMHSDPRNMTAIDLFKKVHTACTEFSAENMCDILVDVASYQ